MTISIVPDELLDGQVVAMLQDHLKDMYATSPAESVHALEIEELREPNIQFWVAKKADQVLGCVAVKEHNKQFGEIKSMRTTQAARRLGIGQRLLQHVIGHAKKRGYQYLRLETGAMEFFAPARALYKKYGFYTVGPFADYVEDEHSVFMELRIAS